MFGYGPFGCGAVVEWSYLYGNECTCRVCRVRGPTCGGEVGFDVAAVNGLHFRGDAVLMTEIMHLLQCGCDWVARVAEGECTVRASGVAVCGAQPPLAEWLRDNRWPCVRADPFQRCYRVHALHCG